MSLGVHYDKEVKIAAVGPSVWSKLGPERWFTNYKIVCASSRDFAADYVIDMHFKPGEVEPLTTQQIMETPKFRRLATTQLPDYRFVPYRLMHAPAPLGYGRFIAHSPEYARFENKRVFRELFANKLRLPRFVIVASAELFARGPTEAYEQYSTMFGPQFVIQDEASGGGRGTFIIRTADDLQRALGLLKAERPGKNHCVISQFIAGVERSIQVCITRGGLTLGPVQQQLVRNAELLRPEGRGGMFFCGGRLVEDVPERVDAQIKEAVHIIGNELQAAGYKGIFGVDFLVDSRQQVYALEVNARTTGLLPLINEQQEAVPLYLQHILELAGEAYELDSASPGPQHRATGQGPQSFVILFNMGGAQAYFDTAVTTGNYRRTPEGLQKIDGSPRWNADADVMLQLFRSPGFPSKPNLKLCNIFLKGAGFNDQGELEAATRSVVSFLKAHIVEV